MTPPQYAVVYMSIGSWNLDIDVFRINSIMQGSRERIERTSTMYMAISYM
jgi:hypothetical protein